MLETIISEDGANTRGLDFVRKSLVLRLLHYPVLQNVLQMVPVAEST